MTYCGECLNKQQKINELEEEIASLKSKLHYQERTAKEGFFGSSTPSSKLPVKPSSQVMKSRKTMNDVSGLTIAGAHTIISLKYRIAQWL